MHEKNQNQNTAQVLVGTLVRHQLQFAPASARPKATNDLVLGFFVFATKNELFFLFFFIRPKTTRARSFPSLLVGLVISVRSFF
jgi:hypothetical protein